MNIKKIIENKILSLMKKVGGGVSDEKYLKFYSLVRTGKSIDFRNPTTYNEKINWIKLYDRDPNMTICADKYKVREVIKKKIGEKYLVPLLWSGDNPEEIPYETLPNSFALKVNNASGANIIVEDKSELNILETQNRLKKWLKQDNYTGLREWVYKDIKPRIVCEQFLKQDDHDELRDYRFFCFNGEPKFIMIDFDINDKVNARRNLYDLNWNLLDRRVTYPNEKKFVLDRPKKLEEMIELSRVLSKNFAHVRIDFYYIKNEIYFGEMTFYHQSGMASFEPKSFDKELGELLKLPIKGA